MCVHVHMHVCTMFSPDSGGYGQLVVQGNYLVSSFNSYTSTSKLRELWLMNFEMFAWARYEAYWPLFGLGRMLVYAYFYLCTCILRI